MTKSAIYLPGLNGIRAIAAIGVLISHIILSLDDFGLNQYLLGTFEDKPRNFDLAGHGVSMFFALSGFLITFLLCKEKEIQRINIKKFYLRRILRIWPLYYAYLIVVLIIYVIFQIDFEYSSTFFYFFYSANVPFVIGGVLPMLSHYWSLGVEEQFYLFWPLLARLKIKKLLLTTLLLTSLLLGLKIYLHFIVPNTILEGFISVTRFQCMLIGAAAAIMYYSKHTMFIKIMTNPLIQIGAWLCILLVALNRFHIASVIDTELISGITAIIIIGQISKKGLINLENKPLDFLGKISYGIYIIHPLIIFLYAQIHQNISSVPFINYTMVFSVITLTTLLLAHLSYKYYESIFLRIKKRKHTVVESQATMKPQ